MASTIGKVRAVFTASTSGLTAGVNAAASSMRRLQGSVASLRSGMNALVAIQGAQLFGSVVSGAVRAANAFANLGRSAASYISEAVNEATALGEETSKSGVIFGQAAAQIGQFAAGASAIGLSNSAALQATGSFGNLFTAMGIGQQQAADYSTAMVQLGADLASFNNTSVDDAILAIGAALRGESEPIRRFGVLLDEATLKQEALNAGLIQSTTGSLTPAIKAQAAYAAILKQTSAAQGDFQRTSGSLANLGRVVQAQTANIFGDIGQAFQPLFQSVTQVISRVLAAVRPFIQDVSNGIRSALEVIGEAVANLVPAFESFLGGLDGGALGERISQGIITGARFLAQVGDRIITAVPQAFAFLSSVGQQWAAVFDVGNRVANAFIGAFNLFEIVGNLVGGIIANAIAGIYRAAAALSGVIPGLGEFTRGLTESADGWAATVDEYNKAIQTNADEAGAAFSAAFSVNDLAKTGEAIAGPLESALDQAIAAAGREAAALDVEQKVEVAVKQPVAVDAAPIKAAVQGVDSRSSEGIKEMFRVMRGERSVAERQLEALREIADNTADDGGAAVDMEVLNLAPAAGA